MLDTSNIHTKELSRAMYEESIKTWTDAYKHACTSLTLYIKQLRELDLDLIGSGDQAEYDTINLAQSLSVAINQEGSNLKRLLYFKPSMPEEE